MKKGYNPIKFKPIFRVTFKDLEIDKVYKFRLIDIDDCNTTTVKGGGVYIRYKAISLNDYPEVNLIKDMYFSIDFPLKMFEWSWNTIKVESLEWLNQDNSKRYDCIMDMVKKNHKNMSFDNVKIVPYERLEMKKR